MTSGRHPPTQRRTWPPRETSARSCSTTSAVACVFRRTLAELGGSSPAAHPRQDWLSFRSVRPSSGWYLRTFRRLHRQAHLGGIEVHHVSAVCTVDLYKWERRAADRRSPTGRGCGRRNDVACLPSLVTTSEAVATDAFRVKPFRELFCRLFVESHSWPFDSRCGTEAVAGLRRFAPTRPDVEQRVRRVCQRNKVQFACRMPVSSAVRPFSRSQTFRLVT